MTKAFTPWWSGSKEREKEAGKKHNFQRHIPSDLLPQIKLHLLKFPVTQEVMKSSMNQSIDEARVFMIHSSPRGPISEHCLVGDQDLNTWSF
jgi:hypothetical protein